MKRILIIGTSGSGKTTLAKRLSEGLCLPFIATDPWYWGKEWSLVPHEEVRQQIEAVVDHQVWVLDGNFDNERDLVWQNADCILWLDYPLSTILFRVITRNLWWWITSQTVWSGNRMTLSRALSGIRHTVRSYAIKRNNYPAWLATTPNCEIHRFRHGRETKDWLRSINK